MGYVFYEKGKPFKRISSVEGEGCIVELTPHGLDIIVMYDNPTEEEIRQFEYGNYFEIRETIIYDKVIYFTFKAGNLPWHDAPYTPHLTREMPDLNDFNEGMPVTMFIVDSNTKVIKSNIRQLILGIDFTNRLKKSIILVQGRTFSPAEYDECLAFAQMKYSIEDLKNMSSNICTING